MKKILLALSLLISGASSAQFAENFDFPNSNPNSWTLPSGQWTQITSGTGTDWEMTPAASAQFPSLSPQRAALIKTQNIGSGNSSSDYLVTPLLTISPDGFFRFFSRTLVAGNQGTTYELRIAPSTSDPTQMSSFTTLVASWNEDQISASFNTYQYKSVTLPGAPGTQVYMAFVRNFSQSGSAGSDGWLIDDIANFSLSNGCGGFFTDAGGPGANYANGANETTTICPDVPGDLVTVTFIQFQTESATDGLYVYDGNSLTAPQISSSNGAGFVPGGVPGAYWGSALPGPFTSSSADGCLTFRFRSDNFTNMAGWIAQVSCESSDECPAPAITSIEPGVTAATVDWSFQGSPASWEVLALPCGSPPPAYETAGIATSTHPYLVTSLAPNTCYSIYVRSDCGEFGGKSQWSAAGEALTMGDQLILTAFLDANNNGVRDSGELPFTLGNFTYEWNDSGEISDLYSPDGSAYLLGGSDENFFDITFEVFEDYASYYQVSPASYEDVVIAVGGGQQFLDFAVTLSNPYQDVSVVINAIGQPRPAMTYQQNVTISNYGVSPATGTLTFTADPGITNIAGPGIVLTANGFTYDFSNLAPMQSVSLWVTLTVADVPVVNLGDMITNTATVTASGTDLNPDNNFATSSAVAVNSYDPNDITESHGPEIDVDEFDTDDYLYYTVRFQNTGTANALTVSINLAMDARLDWESAQMVASSHNYDLHRNGSNLLWFFYNINLVPQSQSETLSQGWILFKVRVNPGIEAGDTIPAVANIFFDTNSAVVTDTFTTTFVDALSTPDLASDTIALFPNPTRSSFTVKSMYPNETVAAVLISDVFGKTLLTSTNLNNDNAIDISGLSQGIYLVTVTLDTGKRIVKKVVKN